MRERNNGADMLYLFLAVAAIMVFVAFAQPKTQSERCRAQWTFRSEAEISADCR